MLVPLGILYEELVVLHVGCCLRNGTPVVGLLTGSAVLPDDAMLLEVDQRERLLVANGHDGFVGVGERGGVEVTDVVVVVALGPLVDVVEGKELFLLASLLVNQVALLDIGTH